jgi:hypothetical protein
MISKGEWKVYEVPATYLINTDNMKNIASCKTEDDAHLIAAAPDMYEAIQIALDLVKTVLYEHPTDATAILQKTVIERALAKAEGREDGNRS